MLRTAVLVFGCAVLLLGGYLCTLGVGFGGVQTVIFGAIVVLGTLFERWRYNNRNASVEADWEFTGEQFVDPATGKEMEVLYDPRSGERKYQEIQ